MAGWITDNRLSVAPQKSKFMLIGTDSIRKKMDWEQVRVKVEGENIERTSSEKLLGLTLNQNLSWSSHLHGTSDQEGLIVSMRKRIGMIKRISSMTTQNNLKILAEGIVLSKMRFRLPLYATVFETQIYKENNTRHRMFTREKRFDRDATTDE